MDPSDREKVYIKEELIHDNPAFDLEREKNVNMFYDNGAFANVYKRTFAMLGSLEGKRLLEYGCGNGKNILQFVQKGAHYTGIDISNRRILEANKIIRSNSLEGKAEALRMNAERLDFADNSFDVVYGEAIIHHLDIDTAMREIKRVLKKNAMALFVEPKGENPIINIYRKRTPHLRTEDEKPLTSNDFEKFREYFNIEVEDYFLFSLAAFIFRRFFKSEPLFRVSKILLDGLDTMVFRLLPFSRKYSWYCVIKMTNKNFETIKN